ncbi:MAG TPA: hypothetical protein PK954_07390, partial [Anaerolineales bacterium]|nr:hypothetical protein [Anaerolineales bacterium]
ALPIVRRTGNRFAQCIFLVNSSRARVLVGDYGPALPQAQEALLLAGQMENRYLRAQALTALGWAQAFQGEREQANRSLTEALRLHAEMGNEPYLLDVIVGLARLAALASNSERAARLVALAVRHHAADPSLQRLAEAVWRGAKRPDESPPEPDEPIDILATARALLEGRL